MAASILLGAHAGVGRWTVGPDVPPFMVAEMSGNHNGSLDRALALVEAAGAAGAHGFKIQTFTVGAMTPSSQLERFRIRDLGSPWAKRRLSDLYAETMVPRAWHKRIFQRARDVGMIPFSTPFSADDVDFLDAECGPDCYKVASFEITDRMLIRRVARTFKPVILSTGMATIAEIWDAYQECCEHGSGEVVLLKCTSAYPAGPGDANLLTIPHLAAFLECPVGLSDHSLGIGVAVAAVGLGASVVEKHLTLDRAEGGPDSAYSMEPEEFTVLVRECASAWLARGKVFYGATPIERPSLAFRRSLYVVADMVAGEVLTAAHVGCLRPAGGLPPQYLDAVLGMAVRQPVEAGTALTWDLVKPS